MTKRKPKNQLQQDKLCKSVRKRYKKRFKKGIGVSDGKIKKLMRDWLNDAKQKVLNGKRVYLDKHSYIEVVGKPILEVPQYVQLARKGKVLVGGIVKNAEGFYRRKDFVYGIEYINSKSKGKLYFEPSRQFSGGLSKRLNQTNTYYKITESVTKNKLNK